MSTVVPPWTSVKVMVPVGWKPPARVAASVRIGGVVAPSVTVVGLGEVLSVGLATLTVFYPSSTTPQFTSFTGATDRSGELLVKSPDGSASASLCTSCDAQTCMAIPAGHGLPTQTTPAGAVISVPPGPPVTASFFWF